MSLIVDPTAKQLIDAVLQLADTFGVFASVYTTVRDSRIVCWKKSGFDYRKSALERYISVIVLTPSGEVGRMCTDDWSLTAVERAFHLAKDTAVQNPALLEQLERLGKLEERSLPLLADEEKQDKLPPNFFREVEQHHRQCQNLLAPQPVTTICTVNCDQFAAGRSDGTYHQVSVWRADFLNEWQDQKSQTLQKLRSSTSAPSARLLNAEQLAAPSVSKLRRLVSRAAIPEADPVRVTTEPSTMILDAEATTAILFAAFLTGTLNDPPPTAASVTIEPNEGIPGYYPLHPYGYLLTPEVICSPKKHDRPYVQALHQNIQLFASHLTFRLPSLGSDENEHDPAEICAQLSARGLINELQVLRGVARFHWDPDSDLFVLLPASSYRWQQGRLIPRPPSWLYCSFSGWLSGCLGGVGPVMLEWPDYRLHWTVSAQQYTLLQID
ncbi:hypothetical protein LOK74_05070 [Brevibacillus humidisoli]|uniref:hypothetical protein n=1 Tax=Brevibacillus humidisoli TaxID=2895522 RepID=UPI001E41B43B|nr:hypothetical protein [Brevibacillus humidisoli]UFJ41877.1 hypothetical protein LOK74_05070 [Brevibacillus humidisoli]